MEKWCKKHPSHKQAKGVCPSCLRERLSHLSASSSSATNTNASNSSSSSDPYLSGSNFSSAAADSPPHLPPLDPSSSDVVVDARKPLKKSRSLAFVLEEEKLKEKIDNSKNKNKKKGNFWSQLIIGSGSSSRKEQADGKIARSKTIKEKYSVKCVPF